jgi:HipA-like protein
VRQRPPYQNWSWLFGLEALGVRGDLVARIRMNKASRLSLDYEPGWRDSPSGYSLSVNMPLVDGYHTRHRKI